MVIMAFKKMQSLFIDFRLEDKNLMLADSALRESTKAPAVARLVQPLKSDDFQ